MWAMDGEERPEAHGVGGGKPPVGCELQARGVASEAEPEVREVGRSAKGGVGCCRCGGTAAAAWRAAEQQIVRPRSGEPHNPGRAELPELSSESIVFIGYVDECDDTRGSCTCTHPGGTKAPKHLVKT